LIEKNQSSTIFKFQIAKDKYQMVRQAVRPADGPEQSRRGNHNDQNPKFQTLFEI
jgi:hypothetical protein